MFACRLAFIKSLTAAPTDAAQLQRTSQWWLGSYGLLLPPSFPFLVGVATHPEAEAAQMQVCLSVTSVFVLVVRVCVSKL